MTMWWALGIIGVVCFAFWLFSVWANTVQARGVDQEYVLEKIANEYLARHQEGGTLDQTRDALYRHYSITKPVEFWQGHFSPIPFGNLVLAWYARKMPEDALLLGEITYTILCNRGIYPSPHDGQGPRDSACEYDAMTKICGMCMARMVALEATGNKLDPHLWEMMREWSALDNQIAVVNASSEETLERSLRDPERPEMPDKTEGAPPSEGLFGTKWLMPMEEVLQVVPQPEETRPNAVGHFGKYHGRRATFSYYFKNHLLTEISICLNNSSEKEFRSMHARLSADFGKLPEAVPSDHYQLYSTGAVSGVVIEHSFFDHEHVGLTEMITFRKEP